MVENMKVIPGHPNYSITEDGRVWSKKSKIYLKPMPDGAGYLSVDLRDYGKRKYCKVYRLVLETFVGPCPEGMQCRHLDGNKLNNHCTNLKWGSAKENAQDAIKHGTHNCFRVGEKHNAAKLTEFKVYQIRMFYATGDFIQQELADEYGISRRNISYIINRKTWKHI